MNSDIVVTGKHAPHSAGCLFQGAPLPPGTVVATTPLVTAAVLVTPPSISPPNQGTVPPTTAAGASATSASVAGVAPGSASAGSAAAAVSVVTAVTQVSWAYSLGRDFSLKTSTDVWLAAQRSVCDTGAPMCSINYINGHVDFDRVQLSHGARAVHDCPNAGGASEKSEAISVELLRRVFGASLERTEMNIEYHWGNYSKKTDYTIRLWGRVLGVSVTRARKWYGNGALDLEDARRLLHKKLYGVRMSTRDVIDEHAWKQQILHIFTESAADADLLQAAYATVPREERANTVVLITVCAGADYIFTNRNTARAAAAARPKWGRASKVAKKAQPVIWPSPVETSPLPKPPAQVASPPSPVSLPSPAPSPPSSPVASVAATVASIASEKPCPTPPASTPAAVPPPPPTSASTTARVDVTQAMTAVGSAATCLMMMVAATTSAVVKSAVAATAAASSSSGPASVVARAIDHHRCRGGDERPKDGEGGRRSAAMRRYRGHVRGGMPRWALNLIDLAAA